MDYQFSNKHYSRFITIILFIIFSQQVKSQHTDDIGIFLGGSFYMGDINPDKLFYKPSPAYGIMYRFNYNPMISMSYELIQGRIQANDLDFNSNLFQHYRGASFSNNTITEVSSQLEYNLYPVSGDKIKTNKFSPYIKVGVGIAYDGAMNHTFQIVIPFALGLKYKITKKVEIGTEWSFRRTFTDKLDNLGQYYSQSIFVDRQRSFSQTRDWYSFFGINLHYCLKKTNLKCPAYSNFQ
jgi:hypothetical protein